MTTAKTQRIREDLSLETVFFLSGVAKMVWIRDYCVVVCVCGLVLLFAGDFGVTKAKTLRIHEDPCLGFMFLLPGVVTMPWTRDFCVVACACGLVL